MLLGPTRRVWSTTPLPEDDRGQTSARGPLARGKRVGKGGTGWKEVPPVEVDPRAHVGHLADGVGVILRPRCPVPL